METLRSIEKQKKASLVSDTLEKRSKSGGNSRMKLLLPGSVKERLLLGKIAALLAGPREHYSDLRPLAAAFRNGYVPDLLDLAEEEEQQETILSWILLRAGWKLNPRFRREFVRTLLLSAGKRPGGENAETPQGKLLLTVKENRKIGFALNGPKTLESLHELRAAEKKLVRPDADFHFLLLPATGWYNGYKRLFRAGNTAVLFPFQAVISAEAAAAVNELNRLGLPFGFLDTAPAAKEEPLYDPRAVEKAVLLGAMFFFRAVLPEKQACEPSSPNTAYPLFLGRLAMREEAYFTAGLFPSLVAAVRSADALYERRSEE